MFQDPGSWFPFPGIARASTLASIMAGLVVATRVSQRWGALEEYVPAPAIWF